ncbi:MAG: hypothetical protein LUE17_02490 [Planctomycetaceae bacterium]|nr:hypothetical protein [Planctomycetaceae bacterium]
MFAKLKYFTPVMLLTLGHGLVDSYGGMLQVLAPGLAAYLGIPIGEVVMLIGASALVNNLIQPTAAYIMGNRNLAWVLWLAIIMASSAVFMGFATGIVSLSIIITIGAAGTGLYHPEAVLSAHDASGEKSYLGIPFFMAGGAAIYAAMTPLSIRVTESYGFPALAWFVVPAIVVAGIFLLSYRKRKREHPSVMIRPRSKRITRVQDGALSYWPLLAVGMCMCIATGLFLAILSSHFELLFGPEARHWSGWVLMVMGVGSSLSSFLWSSLTRSRGFYPVALGTQLLAFPLLVLMAYVPSPEWGFLVSLPLCIVTPASIHPAAAAAAKNMAGATQALRMSLMMGGTFAAASIVIMIAGALMRRGVTSSSIVVFIAICALMAALIAGWQIIALRRKRTQA